jgi:hypothetical protein
MATLYLKGIEQAWKGNIVVGTDDFKLAFMSTSYTPNSATHQYWSDISASIASGTTVRTLTNVTFTIDGANNRVTFDCDNVSEASVTAATDKFVIFKDTGTPATSLLIACVDITEGTLSPIAGTLAINFSANGIFGIKAIDS